MPRPGPRPYKLVKRAWHSERHEPMRGSLIQEIFRVVNEIHSPATKKNKEWQEKLPDVVLGAEKIMYFKANSEGEYADRKTLLERLNDAIDTIIRRDESTETGDFLQPCIEAALTLGCTPRRVLRSQRHNNPRCYLSPSKQEVTETSLSPHVSSSMAYEGPLCLRPPQSGNPKPSTSQFIAYHSTLATAPTLNAFHPGSNSGSTFLQEKPMLHHHPSSPPISSSEFPHLFEDCALPHQDKPLLPVDACPAPSSGCMYPLYHISRRQTMEPGHILQNPQVWNCDAVLTGTSQALPMMEPRRDFLLNLLGHNNAPDAPKTTTWGSSAFVVTSEKTLDAGCDLSQRLGPLPALSLSMENNQTSEDLRSISPYDRHRLCNPSSSKMRIGHLDCQPFSSGREREFCFFPMDPVKDPLETCTKRSSDGESLKLEGPIRKRKEPVGNSFQDKHFYHQLQH